MLFYIMKKLLFIIIFNFLLPMTVWGAETLVCARPQGQTTPMHVAAEKIIVEAFEKIGITCEIRYLPGERSLLNTNNGINDVEILRISGLKSKYPNLLEIPVSTVVSEQMAWSRHSINVDKGWESLRPYRIAVVRGYKTAEKNTAGMNVHVISTWKQAFKLAEIGRVDLALASRFSGMQTIRELELKDIIKALEPPLVVTPLYPYLHKKHEALLPQITKALQDMLAENRFNVILEQEKEKFKKGEGIYSLSE